MSITLVEKYSPKVDEIFKAEAKASLVTNTDYDFTGAHSVQIYKVGTASMNDYQRNKSAESASDTLTRYGALLDLNATTEQKILRKDRSFIYNLDKLDLDETGDALEVQQSLARQIRQVVIPEIDTYVFAEMVSGAGTTATAASIDESNVYDLITAGTEVLDDAEVPDTERVLVCTPAVYRSLKKYLGENGNNTITEEQRMHGVVGIIDGMEVVKVPSSRLPQNFGFMICHPSATTAPVKLEDYNTHENTPLASGVIVTGRVCYDAFVLDNKVKGIYFQPIA